MTQIECCRISSTVCAGQQIAAVFFKMYLFVCMKLEGLSPPVLHCTVTEFNPVQFFTAYFLAVYFNIIFYYQRAVFLWVFGQNFV
jgi:hypothetical protein